MSETSPMPKPQKSRSRWLWVFLAMLFVVPVIMFVGLVGLYVLRSQVVFHDYASREAQRAVEVRMYQDAVRAPAAQSIPALPAVVDTPKRQAQIVRVQLDFEDFETRFANAIAVDYENQRSRLMVPSEVFASISGKINGRIVTRTAGSPKLVEVSGDLSGGGPHIPGMPGMGMGGMSMGGTPIGVAFNVVEEFPELGLTELVLNNFDLTPVRVVGDFPVASIGDKLTIVSLPVVSGTLRELTVLGIDESVQLGDGRKLDHLLKLTEWTGTTGALVCNSTGDPVAQIVFTKPGKLRYSYAVPMDRIFQAIYDQRQLGHAPLPVQPESFPGPDSRPPLVGDLRDDEPASMPKVPSEIPQDPLTSSPPGLRLEDSSTPPAVPQATETFPADASVPEISPDRETRVYRVVGFAPNMANTIRSLYGDVAKIAVDSGSATVIAIAPSAVQDKIATMIEELNTRAQKLQDERAKMLELEEEQRKTAFQQAQARQNESYAKEAESNRKQPKRTRLIKVTGRDPQEVAKVLTTLFGQSADVAIDERTGSVLITINRATTLGEVQFLLTEIEATATRLMEDPSVSSISPKMTEQNRFNPAERMAPSVSPGQSQEQFHAEQDREARKLAVQLRAASPADQPALRAKLEQLTEQQFQARQDLRKKEIDDLGNRIDQLRVTHLRRQQNQAEIIRRRIDELLDPNNDLRWEPSQSNTEAPAEKPTAISSEEFKESTKEEVPKGASVEQTFDGITYSQWLKILETEVKPTKLAAAIEACGRLAVSADRRRIAKMIIQKASLSEAAAEVWNAADDSLSKFPMTDVIDEILISLADPKSAERGRTFQGVFLSHYPKAVKERELELVAGLVKAVQENGEDRNCLLAAACKLWRDSEHRLDDFEGLRPLVMERIDNGPEATVRLDDDWYTVALTLVMKNPETAGLAAKLMKYAARDDDFEGMINLLGVLGRFAEPAVPAIISRILAELKEIEPARQAGAVPVHERRATLLVQTLGAIGVGDNAARLLKELSLIANPYILNTLPFHISQEARKALDKFAAVPNGDGPPILGDEFLVRGIWQLHSANFEKPADCEAWIGRDNIDLRDAARQGSSSIIDGNWIAGHVKLDPTKMVKEIVLTNPEGSKGPKRNGIYELTETTFKIYLAPLNKPAPTEMFEEGSAIPDGYSLVEWRRSLPISSRP